MATQDDINNLIEQIANEQQSAIVFDQQISAEQQRSAQLIDGWHDQARRHRDAASRMQRDLESKQQQLKRELEQEQNDTKAKRDAASRIARRFL